MGDLEQMWVASINISFVCKLPEIWMTSLSVGEFTITPVNIVPITSVNIVTTKVV